MEKQFYFVYFILHSLRCENVLTSRMTKEAFGCVIYYIMSAGQIEIYMREHMIPLCRK